MVDTAQNSKDFNSKDSSAHANVLKHCFDACSTTFKSDILFIIDASGSIGLDNYIKQIQFVKNLINNMNLDENEQKVGIVIYENGVKKYLPFTSINQTIFDTLNTPYSYGSNTYTNDALKKGAEMFTKYSRLTAGKIMFLLTDGASSDVI